MRTDELMEKEPPAPVRRFGMYRIVEHCAIIVLFATLLLTGLPQKFHTVGISSSVIILLGGIDTVRFIHHTAGILFALLAVEHILVNILGILLLRRDPTMLVTLNDARDALHNVRYYLELDSDQARCGRYTYKEKCIYWLVLIGGTQMIITGFILWFPVIVTHSLPGQFIPVAKVIHTSEAMLLFLLVVTWHIYDSIFNPEVFPLNKSIFTGYSTKRQMQQRHPLEQSRSAPENIARGDMPGEKTP